MEQSDVASILLRFQIPTRVLKERKGLYSEKCKELHSEGRFVILSRQTQQGIPGDSKYPPECSKNEKDCIRRSAKNFIVNEGLLFYRDKHNKEYRVSYIV